MTRRLAILLLLPALMTALSGCGVLQSRRAAFQTRPAAPPAAAMDEAHARALFLVVLRRLHEQGKDLAVLAYLDGYDRRAGADDESRLLRADCLRATGRAAQAVPLYTSLLDGRLAAPARAGLGGAAAARGDWPGAVQAYRQAVARAPTEAAYVNDLGIAQMKAGDLRAAIASLDQAQQLAPGDRTIRNNRVLAAHLAAHDAEAEALVAGIGTAVQEKL